MAAFKHKGDFLTFASIGEAVGAPLGEWRPCEIKPGIYRRHWTLKVSESRSDISRDGYLGVLLYSLVAGDKERLSRVLIALAETGGKVGERGAWDYTNMLPLLPFFLAARFKWFPWIPLWIPEAFKTGFRAHLAAILVMCELEDGVNGWSSRRVMRQLCKANPANPLFRSILTRMEGGVQGKAKALLHITEPEDSPHGWGSCPWAVFKSLTLYNISK